MEKLDYRKVSQNSKPLNEIKLFSEFAKLNQTLERKKIKLVKRKLKNLNLDGARLYVSLMIR